MPDPSGNTLKSEHLSIRSSHNRNLDCVFYLFYAVSCLSGMFCHILVLLLIANLTMESKSARTGSHERFRPNHSRSRPEIARHRRSLIFKVWWKMLVKAKILSKLNSKRAFLSREPELLREDNRKIG